MNITIISHDKFKTPDHVETWTKKHGHAVQIISPYQGDSLSHAKPFDFLIVLGGPQSPIDMDKFPYLKDEIFFIKQAIHNKKRILGICLGAQLLGEALGAKTIRIPEKEIGMHPIELLEEAKNDAIFSLFPQKFAVMHWHNDMAGIAEGVVLLAKSEACAHQIFRYGDKIYGIQPHFEFTKEIIHEMVENYYPHSESSSSHAISSITNLMQVNCMDMNKKIELILDKLAS